MSKKHKKKINHRRSVANIPIGLLGKVNKELRPVDPIKAMQDGIMEKYAEKMRNSPLWDEMVRQYGLEQAEELMKEFSPESKKPKKAGF
jgi:hypothetical protein